MLLASMALHAYENTVELTREDLQQHVDSLMPVQSQLLMIQLALSDPQVSLPEGQNRIAIASRLRALAPGLIDATGRAELSGTIRYQRQEGAFYLDQPVINALQIDQIPAQQTEPLKELLEVALSHALLSTPIYTLSKDNMKERMAKMMLKRVEVRDQKLLLHLDML